MPDAVTVSGSSLKSRTRIEAAVGSTEGAASDAGSSEPSENVSPGFPWAKGHAEPKHISAGEVTLGHQLCPELEVELLAELEPLDELELLELVTEDELDELPVLVELNELDELLD